MQSRNFFQRIWSNWSLDLTPFGRALVITGIVAVSIGSSSTQIDTYILTSFFISIATINEVLAFFFRPKVSVQYYLPEIMHVGESKQVYLQIQNIGEKENFDIVVRWADLGSYLKVTPAVQRITSLKPKEKITLQFQFTPQQRGHFQLRGFRVDSPFPFGLVSMGRSFGRRDVAVCPAPWAEEKNWQMRIPQQQMNHFSRDEYIGNREYQSGDQLSQLDWRAWARLGKPIVREYRQNKPLGCAIFISAPIDSTKEELEKYLSYLTGVFNFFIQYDNIEIKHVIAQQTFSGVPRLLKRNFFYYLAMLKVELWKENHLPALERLLTRGDQIIWISHHPLQQEEKIYARQIARRYPIHHLSLRT